MSAKQESIIFRGLIGLLGIIAAIDFVVAARLFGWFQ